MNTNINKVQKEDDIDVKKVLAKYIDYWKMYLISLIACFLFGYLFIVYVTPMYETDARLLVENDPSQESASLLNFGQSLNNTNLDNELIILTTRDLLEKVVSTMSLNVTYYRQSAIWVNELYDKSPFAVTFIPGNKSFAPFQFQINFSNRERANGFVVSDLKSDSSYKTKFDDTLSVSQGKLIFKRTGKRFEDINYLIAVTPVRSAISDLFKNLFTEIKDAKSTVINLTYNTNIPSKGEDVLNTLIQEYVRRNLNEKNRVSDSSIAFISSRIVLVSEELKAIESDIEHFEQVNKITDIGTQSIALVGYTHGYYNDLNQVEVQLNVIETTLKYLQDVQNNNRPVPSLLNNDPTFLQLVSKYNTLQGQRDQLLFSLKEGNTMVKNLDLQIQNVRQDMIKSLQSQQKAAELSKQQILSQNASTNNSIYNMPTQERAYLNLTRERDVKQQLYLYLLQKKEETAVTRASNISNASVIETPQASLSPYFPNKYLVFGISFFLGIALPTGFVMIKYALNNKIDNKDDILKETDCNILAEIGHNERKIELLSMEQEGRSILAEQFRIFRTNLSFLISKRKCAKILITSAKSGEGKSFISAHLALIYAYSGKKTLLMELDLRKPHLSNLFKNKNEYGFSNFILSHDRIENYIKPVPNNANLFLLSSGPVPPNPTELLMLPVLPEIFEKLSQQFDVIIMDTPPIGLVADAQILAEYSDVNLFVIRERYSFKNSLEIINDLLQNKKFSNLYLVVNDVKKGASYKYGYGYSYGHSYGNGNGNGYYGEPHKYKKTPFNKIFGR
jgi:tyrosine-protein kinase Etk/Wzc